jgi:hydrogenase nickel incorporation protein HypB
MCATCGCGTGDATIGLRMHGASGGYRVAGKPSLFPIGHRSGAAAHGAATVAPLGVVHAPGIAAERVVAIERDLLAANDLHANENRMAFTRQGILALNLVSSPGAGKTTLLVRTLEALQGRWPLAVIEGDQETTRDADRIRATGVPALQINTGKGCHLDARMIAQALPRIVPEDGGILFIENVGNLVCPAAFDLGEDHKVVVLSVTEGDDKPLKYPGIFRAADLMVVNKIDLLPYVRFDVAAAVGHARTLNPGMAAILVSATTEEGMADWLDWLEDGLQQARARAVAFAEQVAHVR